ncbi:MAG: cation diffusion facilitator family transporter [Desulfuromonadales bacterium]|nr:cation diffusion facilitator family transporter [Desulfuromonadales bacterium]
MEISEKTAWLSILTNIVLVLIKSFLALLSGSLAIKADAIHSLSDVVSSSVILIGIKISKRSTSRFPYGLYKVENLVALGTSFLILLAGYEIVREVFSGSSQLLPQRIPLAAAGILLTIIITWRFSRYELKKGQETGSPSLIADARHIWTDMLSSLVILASLIGSALGWAVDRYAAIIVVIFICRAAFTIFLNAIRVLLDASLDHASLDRIREIVLNDPRVTKINEIRGRNAGRYKFVELDLTLRAKNLKIGHRIVEDLKQQVKNRLENVDHVLVHYAPQVKETLVLGIPLKEDGLSVSEHFGEAPFFRLVTLKPEDDTIIMDIRLKNPFMHEEKGKGLKVANWLLEKGLDVMIVRQELEGKGAGYVLGDAETETVITTVTLAEQAIERVRTAMEKIWPTDSR